MANGNCATLNGGGSSAVPDNTVVSDCERALKHKIGVSVTWTRDEQSLLEELLAKFASDSTVLRFAKIAVKLNDKTVRDVALRCRWMSKKENGKQRKDDGNSSRRHKAKKEKNVDHGTTHGNGLPYAQTSTSIDSDDGISYKDIGGASGQLLEQNDQAFDQVSANFAAFKLQENINLLSQTRNNIITLLNDSLNDMPEKMLQMPPLPVKLNEELANSILHRSSFPPMKF